MQKHNKYLVITIWIATIAFIGAGFVGWGSYQYGSKAGNIAKVGDIEIGKAQFDMAYSDLYQRYNQMLQGKLDEKKAREMGLAQQAFSSLAAQALLMNLANRFGIIISEKELADKLAEVPAFQTDGHFDKRVYETYLKNRRLKAKTFEKTIHDELLVQKLFSLLDSKSLPFEEEVLSSALSISDKIAYKVLTPDDVKVDIDEAKIKKFWEAHKSDYMTAKKYRLDILWTDSKDTNVTDQELNDFYRQNSFNYIDDSGRQLTLDEARDAVMTDLKMKKSKKHAQKQYIAYKKGKLNKSETRIVLLNDPSLSPEVWKEVLSHDAGTILKPKPVKSRYATIKIDAVIEPKEMNFEDARKQVISGYTKEMKKEALAKLAQSTLKNIDGKNATVSDFVTLDSQTPLNPLNIQESLQFLQKLFTSGKEKGMITIEDKSVVYRVLEQKFGTLNGTENKELVKKSVNLIKSRDLQSNLIKSLGEQYPVKKFVEGI